MEESMFKFWIESRPFLDKVWRPFQELPSCLENNLMVFLAYNVVIRWGTVGCDGDMKNENVFDDTCSTEAVKYKFSL